MPSGIYTHYPIPEPIRRKMSQANRGKQRTPEQRCRITEGLRAHGVRPPSQKGIKRCDAFRIKCSWRSGEKAPWWGRHHSAETRRKLSELHSGQGGSNWQGGITPITERARHTVEFRIWREAVFTRDKWTCQQCGRRGGRLHPHHIKSFSKYPELRFDIGNGKTLCEDCHKKTKNFGGKAILETEMVRMEQIFLPYIVTKNGTTIYELAVASEFLQLPEGKGQ